MRITAWGETKKWDEWRQDPRTKITRLEVYRARRKKRLCPEDALSLIRVGIKKYDAYGQRLTASEWAKTEYCEVSESSLRTHLAQGQPIEEALRRKAFFVESSPDFSHPFQEGENEPGSALHTWAATAADNTPEDRTGCPPRISGIRRCPYVLCKHHLYLDIGNRGELLLSHGLSDPLDMHDPCTLDHAESNGGMTLDEIGSALNLTKERVRQLTDRALHSMAQAIDHERDND